MGSDEQIFQDWFNDLEKIEPLDDLITFKKDDLKKIMRASFMFGCERKNDQIDNLLDEVTKLHNINHQLRKDLTKALGFHD